jgi:hypothetical protein
MAALLCIVPGSGWRKGSSRVLTYTRNCRLRWLTIIYRPLRKEQTLGSGEGESWQAVPKANSSGVIPWQSIPFREAGAASSPPQRNGSRASGGWRIVSAFVRKQSCLFPSK